MYILGMYRMMGFTLDNIFNIVIFFITFGIFVIQIYYEMLKIQKCFVNNF